MICTYQRLFQIEKSFRIAKADFTVHPILHRTRDSIEAHLNIVFATLAVSHWIKATTGWSIRTFVATIGSLALTYRSARVWAGVLAVGLGLSARLLIYGDTVDADTSKSSAVPAASPCYP